MTIACGALSGFHALISSGTTPKLIEKERQTLETITRNEGKPDQAIPKIVEGRLAGFFKDVVLLEQPYAKDDKVSISQLIGDATILRFRVRKQSDG